MSNKYTIYNNDLKFKENRNIDFDDVDLTKNNISNKINIDHDTIEYRYQECIEHKYFSLDLTSLNLNLIPKLSNNFLNIKCLFLANNKLTGILDITYFKNLISIDIDNNQITNLILPESIEEVSCQHNLIQTISDHNKLKRLKISYNKFKQISNFPNLEILEATNNNIYSLNEYKKLKRLIIYSNPITKIILNNNLIYADLSETLIDDLNKCDTVEQLVLNNCIKLNKLQSMENIKSLELMGTKLNKLNFYKNFEIIIFNINLIQNISSKYKDYNSNFQIRNKTMLCISRGQTIYDNTPTGLLGSIPTGLLG